MRNADFLTRREHAIPAGLVNQAPIFIERAENDQLWDAAALAVLHVIESEGLVSRAGEIGERLFDLLQHLQQGNTASIIGEIRVIGAMVAIEFVTDQVQRTPNPMLAQAVVRHALSDGLILSTCGVYGNVVRILAPLTIRFEVLEEGANILSGSILKALSDAEL